ncbi:hypothetical protein K505DRAFT_307783 [Melanomma pulvis-pyrius CBS 109.77]|uniref:Cell wall proline rich protein n=1 Tax=Melanomma pulvis-pyrius CBS 109.77 TaxID=1314802 RepID=A0A6A6X7L3_9PLEO|nr:hypothetical protein K505DRAFT_307783 [Melanomma pulvis-pyrius CBS 109.77]
MAQIALPRQQVTQTPQSAGVGSPLYQRRHASNAGLIELIPNPDFTFPQRGPDTSPSDPIPVPNARPMSLQAYPTGRRGSAPGLRQKSVSALPDFSFNPAAATLAPPVATTPPHSPLTTPTTPSRPIGGHRRGGSEFIGGDGRSGGVSLMSTSPTKGDGVLPPPPAHTLRPGPPAGRRGHAHRRSGAISSHDLSSIMQPNAPRAGSAPVTPLEGNQFAFGHSVNKSVSQPSLRDAGNFPDDPNSSPRRPPSRARVGFADKVEYIRPLSTISSETETSMSTVRCHSATGSLSSVISAGTSSPQTSRTGRTSLNATMETEERPSTAGAVLDKQKSPHFGGDLFNRKRPMSAVSPTSPSAVTSPTSPRIPVKRRGFFRLESRRSDNGVLTLPKSVSDPNLSASLDSPLPSPMVEDDEILTEPEKVKSTSRKSNRKPRKVKSWANSIIPRKGKHGKKPKSRAPTPPTESAQDFEDTDESDDQDFEANFDVDNTVIIVSPTESSIPARKVDTDIASWKPRELKRVNSDTMSPAIDLDAALGPFNTPDGSAPRSQRGFAAHRRAMHSAGGVLQSHRRTESAPELVPFEFRASAAATTSTMADVFEEDEPEEDTLESNSMSKSPRISAEEPEEEIEDPKIQVVEAEGSQHGTGINWNFTDGLLLRRNDNARKQESSEALSPLEVPQPVPSGNGSKQSLDVSPMSAEQTKEPEALMNMSLPLPQQSLMTPDTFTSSFSSPDFRSSQTSFDTPRLGTASSSLTDYRAMSSPHFGEPGPELRISVDDVPSLTSSRSTMTSAMHNAFPVMSSRRPSDRSASLCSVPGDLDQRRRKRSSIASLSRLINGSSFGEKSKLSIEQRPQSEHLEPTRDSKKKHKRLSKLMQFWKPKESSRN